MESFFVVTIKSCFWAKPLNTNPIRIKVFKICFLILIDLKCLIYDGQVHLSFQKIHLEYFYHYLITQAVSLA